ncbi:helix-turn-helix domain-containing protein [Parablautia muri]|uniref:XRE family transcriptional regulator n=1 Tax=Parablautia muri TaxID=2320879 RepID=A0A9X5GRI1_9FIRM|nr:helix-turn-helix transcriptional regulator [Parablautia muri]NBJ92065.1 XRE family transcriptional regulator [Parablautia muri]
MIKGLPEKLKMLRSKYNLSQREVADKLYVSSSIISGYETGERTPSTENILALAHLYHCTTDYLLGNNIQNKDIILDTTGLSNRQILALQALIETMKG